MNRTPRSASRRARMQLAAYDPGFRASGPYISNVFSGSFDRSASSGTELCIRYAISYCAIRVSISGSPNSAARFAFNCPDKSRMFFRVAGVIPSGSFRNSTGSDPARNFTP